MGTVHARVHSPIADPSEASSNPDIEFDVNRHTLTHTATLHVYGGVS